jgi:hypothetical protein
MLENIREDTREQDTSVMPGEERQLVTQIIYYQALPTRPTSHRAPLGTKSARRAATPYANELLAL